LVYSFIIAWYLFFGKLPFADAMDFSLPGVQGFKPTISRVNRPAPRVQNRPLHTNKPPRAASGFFRVPSSLNGNEIHGKAFGAGQVSGPDKNLSQNTNKNNIEHCTGIRKKRKKKNNSHSVARERVIEAYQEFNSKMKEKGYDESIPNEDRFLELSKNPQTSNFDEKSIFETLSGLELECQGVVQNLGRPENPKIDLDFMAERTNSGETIFIDHKRMIDFGSLADKGTDISKFPSHENVAFKMVKDNVLQKERFIGMENGPKSKSDVVHLYNFDNIRDVTEKPLLVQAVLNGSEQAGHTDGIIFLNYK
jgi:hypothetical protein